MSSCTLPSVVYRLHPKRGEADCAIVALATILRRDPEEVLIAASTISKNVWRAGMHCTEMTKTAKKLGVKTRWKTQIDSEDDIGVLWIGHNDSTREHCVVLIEGWVFEIEHDPVSVWRQDEYHRATNSYASALLEVVEE